MLRAGVPTVPGSDGLLQDERSARVARKLAILS